MKKCLKKKHHANIYDPNDSVIKANKKYYRQTLLEECKYIQEKIKIDNYIKKDLENSESGSDSNNETESDIDMDNYDE